MDAGVDRQTGGATVVPRWFVVAGLLLAEGILLGLCFEGPESGTAWWAVLLSHASNIARFGIAGAAACFVLAGQQIREQLQFASAVPITPRRLWLLLVGHAVAFVGFFRLTAFVVSGDLPASSIASLWVVAWLATGLAAVALCVAVAFPPRAALSLARRLSGLVLAGLVVGGGAVAAGELTSEAWRPLGRLTLSSVNAVISRVAFDSVVDPAKMIVGTQRFSVEIASQCSGYEGIGMMCVFLGAYIWSFRASLRVSRALLLIPLGTLVAWVLNAARITSLVAVGTWVSPEIALGGFHSYSGWLLFCFGALAMVALARRSVFFARVDAVRDDVETENPTAVYLCPLLALVVAGMIAGAFSTSGFDALYPLRVIAVTAALWWFRRDYRSFQWTWSWTAAAAGTAVFVMWMALEFAHPVTTPDGAVRAGFIALPAGWAGAWLSLRVIGSVVTVPIAEELAFRGYLPRRLMAADFDRVSFRHLSWVALLGSSLFFGVMHGRLIAGTLAGLAYGLVLRRRGELCDAVLAHATTNALIAAYVLATGTWSLWV